MKKIKLITLLATVLVIGFACTDSTEILEDVIYPTYLDENSNGVNDYVEPDGHASVLETLAGVMHHQDQVPTGRAPRDHAFADSNNDGICDFAQNGSNTWHGPGFEDSNGNGICDFWDLSHPMHDRHEGMRFQDRDHNQVNDFMEPDSHYGNGHEFIDANEDGICDLAQDGSATWHGPGFVDQNHNGMSDHWERGGRGHGGHMGGGRR